MNGWGKRRQRLGTTFVEMFMVLHPSCLSTMVHKKTKVITELRRMFISGAVWSVFLHLVLSSPPEGAVPGTDRRWRGGCLLDCGGWGLNRAVLCPCWGGICVSGPEHTSLSLSYRSPHVPLLHMFTLKRSPNCLWVRLFFHRRSPPSPLSAK